MFVPRLAPRFDVALVDVRSGRPEFRLEAARSLANADDDTSRDRAREALRPLLDDPVARVRAAAIESLGYVGDDHDLPALCRRLREPAQAVRQVAVVAIARIGTAESQTTLRGLLTSEYPDVRFQAVEALGTLGDPSSTSALVECFDDSDPQVREAAIDAVDAVGGTRHDGVADRLADMLADADEHVRVAASVALVRSGDSWGVAEFRCAISRRTAPAHAFEALIEGRATDATPELRAIVRRPFLHPRVVLVAATALASFGDELGVALLRKRLDSFFLSPRLETLASIARYQLLALAPDVAAIARRPRRIPVDLIAHVLERLDRSPEARDALAHLDRTHPREPTS